MNSTPTATLWILVYEGLTPGTHASVVQEMANWPNLHHSILPGDALVDRARSRAATAFLKTTFDEAGDVLLFADSDISWQPGDLSHIARRALERKAIVGGIYPKRTFGEGSAVQFAAEGQWTIGTDKLIPAKYVGSGFMAIPRPLLRLVAESMPYVKQGFWPVFMAMVVGDDFLSEDYAFCHRARGLGFEVYASAYPRLQHQGSYTYRLVDATAKPPEDKDLTIKLGSSSPALAGDRS